MNNFIQHGLTIDWKNGGSAVVSGELVVVGEIVGVAQVDIPVGEIGPLAVTGVYELPKDSGASGKDITQGDRLYVGASGMLTPAGTADVAEQSTLPSAGVAWADAASAATKVLIKINV